MIIDMHMNRRLQKINALNKSTEGSAVKKILKRHEMAETPNINQRKRDPQLSHRIMASMDNSGDKSSPLVLQNRRASNGSIEIINDY